MRILDEDDKKSLEQGITAAAEAASSKADKTLATASANGLMSAADKMKLDNLDSAISTAISNALAKYDNADTTAY